MISVNFLDDINNIQPFWSKPCSLCLDHLLRCGNACSMHFSFLN
jgi:hypothetical protein